MATLFMHKSCNCVLFKFSRLIILIPDMMAILSDFCDADVFKSHPLFSTEYQALQLLFFFDELEICNLLGSRANTHKIGKLKIRIS